MENTKTQRDMDYAFEIAIPIATALVAFGVIFGYDYLNNGEVNVNTDVELAALVGFLAGPYVRSKIKD